MARPMMRIEMGLSLAGVKQYTETVSTALMIAVTEVRRSTNSPIRI